jgi:hypothetical protein
MSLTPGWEEKDFEAATPGLPVTFDITQDNDFYYLDNGSEFKKWPNTYDGWTELCEELKGMAP